MPRTYLALLIIASIGAYFRFQGLGFDLPNAYNPDDVYTLKRVLTAAGNSYHNAYQQDRKPYFLIARTAIASLSVATIIGVFLLGRAVGGSAVGLVSALVFSLNILEIQYAHELYADTILMFLTVIMATFLAKAYQQKRLLFLIITLGLLGISVALKITAVILIPFYIVLSVSILKDIHIQKYIKLSIYICVIFLTIVTAIFLVSMLRDELRFLQTHRFLDASQLLPEYAIVPTQYADHVRDFISRLRNTMGTLMLLVSFMGILAAGKKRAMVLLVLFAYVLFFFLTIAIVEQDMWDNTMLPILPLLSFFAGLGLIHLYNFLTALTKKRSLGFILCAMLFLPGLVKSYFLAHSYTVPDTRTLEANWFQKHGIDESRVARDAYTSITVPEPDVLTSRLSEQQLRSFDYVVLSSWYSKHFSEEWRNTPELAKLYRHIENSFNKIAVFSPNDSNVFVDDIELLTRWDSWQRLNYVRGPTLSIYTITK